MTYDSLLTNICTIRRYSAPAWISPTGHTDPDSAWINEVRAYDGNTGTAASTSGIGGDNKFIVLSHDPIYCSSLRFWASVTAPAGSTCNLDAYYEGAWHDVYDGAFTHGAWVEKALGGTYMVTAARISFASPIWGGAFLYEFAFWVHSDAYGNPTKAWADHLTNEPCRWSTPKNNEVKVGAEVVIADLQLFLGEGIDITEQDRVILDTATYEVLSAVTRQDGVGSHHVECFLRAIKS